MQGRNRVRLLCAIISLLPLYFLILFIHSFTAPFPIEDQWDSSLPVAAKAKAGDVGVSDLIEMSAGGHRTVFTHAQTAIFARFLHWRVDLAAFVSPALALMSLVVLFLLFRRNYEDLAYLALIPFSMLVFSLLQHINWTMSWESAWYFANLFFLLTLFVLSHKQAGWRPLLLAMIPALCATFSRGHGFLVWPAALPVLWAFRYRWHQQVAWGVAGAFAGSAYFSRSGIKVGLEQDSWKSIGFGDPFHLLHSVLAQLGSTVASEQYVVAVVAALVGLTLWLLNAVYLHARSVSWKFLSVWLALVGFAISTAALISASRREVYDTLALWGGYTTTGILMWIGWIAVALPATKRIFDTNEKNRWCRVLGWANVGTALILLPLYLQTQIHVVQEWGTEWGAYLGYGDSTHFEEVSRCIRRFPVTGDRSCLCNEVSPYISPQGSRLYQMASCGFSPFHDLTPRSVLPGSYVSGSPVIVSSESDGLAAYVRDWMLPGVPEELTFHIIRKANTLTGGCATRPFENPWSGPYPDLLERVHTLGTSGEIWYVSSSDRAHDLVVSLRLQRMGYERTEIEPADEYYEVSRFRVFRFATVDAGE